MVLYMFFNTASNVAKYKFEIIIGTCLLFLFLYALYRKLRGQKGTWTSVGKNNYINVAKNILRTDALNKLGRNNQPSLPKFSESEDSPIYEYPSSQKESKGETECRRSIEKILEKPFSKARPDFLKNEVTGGIYNMELDCYNPELKIAVEYNGQQHYKFIPYFHRNKDRFINQRYRDVLKRKLCEENRVKLIEVPYTVPLPQIEEYLRKKLYEFNL